MLAAVAWKECSWNPDVIYGRRNSRVGAGGIMQIMPDTAIGLGISHADRFIPAIAIPAAAGMLNDLKADFGGSDELMLAGYNAGPGNVTKHGGIPPFS